MTRKLTMSEVKNNIQNINPNVVILDTFYNNANSKMKVKCKKCNHVWGISYSKLRTGRGCPECFNRKRKKFKKFTIQKVKENVSKINPDIEILDNEYVNSKTKLNCKCKKCNNIWTASYDRLYQKRGCPKCSVGKRADKKRQKIKDIKKKLHTINPDIIILDNKYTNTHTKMKCKCKKCDYIWESKWSNLISGRGCKKCGIKRRSGVNSHNYNPSLSAKERTMNRSQLNGNYISQWRKKVFERDNFTCQVCYQRGNDLNAHHLYSYHSHPDERFNVKNGVTLCVHHHKDFHKKFGYRNNTKEQFEEYLQSVQ